MSTFSVFRRNQKLWIAVLGVLTMLSFVFIPTLEQCNRNVLGGNQTVFKTKLFGNLSGSQFEIIRQQQYSVHRVLSDFSFNGAREMVAFTWLQARFAEKMGMTVSSQEIQKRITGSFASKEEYDSALRRSSTTSSEFEKGLTELLLAEKYMNFCLAGIGRQMNIPQMMMPMALPTFPITAEKKWEYFCMMNRSATLQVVPVSAESFMTSAPTPSEDEVKAFFEKHKDTVANPEAGIVGFKVPQKMKVHYFVYEKPGSNAAEIPTEIPSDVPLEPADPGTAPNLEGIEDSIQLDETAPAEAPAEATPAEAAPAEAVPAETPVETAPAEAPAEATPAEAAPAEAVPAEAPAEVAPAEAPVEATPAEAPAEAAPSASNAKSSPFRFAADETVTVEDAPAEAAAPAEAVAPVEEVAPAAEAPTSELQTEVFDADQLIKLVQMDIYTYKSAHDKYNFSKEKNPDLVEPKLEFRPETQAYMDKFGVRLVDLEMKDLSELASEAVAQTQNFNEIQMKKAYTCVRLEDASNIYVAWKSETEDSVVPELTPEVKEKVAASWKLERAKDMAASAAQNSANAYREAKSLDGSQTAPVTVENFSRYMMTQQGPMAVPLEFYAELENVNDIFRTKVFDMKPGEIQVLPNQNRTISYIVKLEAYTPADAELQQQFQQMMEEPMYKNMIDYIYNNETVGQIQNWAMSVFEEAGAEWADQGVSFEEE